MNQLQVLALQFLIILPFWLLWLWSLTSEETDCFEEKVVE